MTTTDALTTLQEARQAREEKLQDAQATFKESVAEANAEFAAELRRDGRPITHQADELGWGRQHLHSLLKRFPATS